MDPTPGTDGTDIVSVTEAAESGDRLLEVVAIVRRLAMALDSDSTPASAIAPLSRAFREAVQERDHLEAMLVEEKVHLRVVPDEPFTAEDV